MMAAYDTYSDTELLALLKEGQEAGFHAIYKRYWQTAYQAALKVLHDEEVCMDVVQDVFVWLWDHRGKARIEQLKPYLLTAVKFKMLNVIRQNRLRDAAYAQLPAEGQSFNYTDSAIEIKELRSMLNQFMESLPEQARKIFHLSRNEQLSNKEIAEKLGLSEKTVKNQINISLKKLRKSLNSFSFWMTFFI